MGANLVLGNVIKYFGGTQNVSQLCVAGQGISVFLFGADMNFAGNLIKALSDDIKLVTTSLTLRSAASFIYDESKKKVTIKQVTKAASSTLKTICEISVYLKDMKPIAKRLAFITFVLDIAEVLINYEKYFKGGATKENILKILAALSYQIIVCATFTISYLTAHVVILAVTSFVLTQYKSWLEEKGMAPIIKIPESVDRLFIPGKLSSAKKMYLRVLGISTFANAVLAMNKLHRNKNANEPAAIDDRNQQ